VTYLTEKITIDGIGKGPTWLVQRDRSDGVRRSSGPRRPHREHRLPPPPLGPSARVALELTEQSALALADAIHRAIASAPQG
jgi:hypothetical protein